MKMEQLLEKIGLPLEGREMIRSSRMPQAEYGAWKTLFYQNKSEFFRRAEADNGRERLFLILYTRFALDIYGTFLARGIPEQIYFDTFRDFSIWCRCCMEKRGVCGLMEEKWLTLPLQMKIFRLGRLQFEPDGTVLHVHIPEDGRLTPESCAGAFRQADQFFDASYTLYDCDSWLMSPKLREIMSEDSNIIRFQKLFRIEKVNYPFRQAEERVFGKILVDKTRYPENTSLQRNLKHYVLNGGDIGIGHGTIYRILQS